ncbi:MULTISPECIES: outer membrane lipoprotein Blc [Dickeya]|uniref:Outer membrane lipoprotein Blc n=1 Tax=Dickeya aquatica TaxID=1401087 RepID=A0A375AFB3_9GAMM|nr:MULTISPECIES: outer membrane lipoprotein Blc [Dickeya]SLM64763.1 possible role for the outer membrane lipoprotein Blc in membrane repair or maintenance requiring lipid storage or transport [Dickeya aquatica]
MARWRLWIASLTALLTVSCSSPTPPAGVSVVENFSLPRYLGTWYEIARFDNRFERGLERVSATYSLRAGGGITVVNRGFDPASLRWRESTGKGDFTGSPTQGALKVSFFGPFYGGYNIIALDNDYQYALVCGPNRDYLWILSRTPTLPPLVRQALIAAAQRNGFDTDKLIWVNQLTVNGK